MSEETLRDSRCSYQKLPRQPHDKDGSETSLDEDESSMGLLGHHNNRYTTSRKPFKKILIGISIILIVGFVSTVLYIATTIHSMQKSLHLHPTGIELGDCGSSHTIEEARELGCLFDPMSWLWVRPECYDKELIADFMNRTEWSWHTEWTLSPETQVPLDVVFSGEYPHLFTAKKYHAIHCTYMWQKMHKALLEHRPVDSDLTSWHHTHHCEEVLLNDYLHEDLQCTPEMICPTFVRATWTSCGYF